MQSDKLMTVSDVKPLGESLHWPLFLLLALFPPSAHCLCCPLLDALWQQQSQEERSWMYSSLHSSSRGGSDCESEQVSVKSSENSGGQGEVGLKKKIIIIIITIKNECVSMFFFPVINCGDCSDQKKNRSFFLHIQKLWDCSMRFLWRKLLMCMYINV